MKKGDWRAATDPKTGRVYYYNVKTRKSTWDKPDILCSDEEKVARNEEKKRQMEIFGEMEQNILAAIKKGEMFSSSPSPDDNPPSSESQEKSGDGGKAGDRKSWSLNDNSSLQLYREAMSEEELAELLEPPSFRPRTISTIDDFALEASGCVMTPSDIMDPTSDGKGGGKGRRRNSLTSHNLNYTGSDGLPLESPPTTPISSNSSKSGKKDGNRNGEEEKSDSKYHDRNGLDGGRVQRMTSKVKFSEEVTEISPARQSWSEEEEDGQKEKLDDVEEEEEIVSRPPLKHRNSTGTIFLGSTLSKPDIEAIQRCVCVVVRAHMLAAFEQRRAVIDQHKRNKEQKRKLASSKKDNKDGDNNNDEEEEEEEDDHSKILPTQVIVTEDGTLIPFQDGVDPVFEFGTGFSSKEEGGSSLEQAFEDDGLASSDDESEGAIDLTIFNDRQVFHFLSPISSNLLL